MGYIDYRLMASFYWDYRLIPLFCNDSRVLRPDFSQQFKNKLLFFFFFFCDNVFAE